MILHSTSGQYDKHSVDSTTDLYSFLLTVLFITLFLFGFLQPFYERFCLAVYLLTNLLVDVPLAHLRDS